MPCFGVQVLVLLVLAHWCHWGRRHVERHSSLCLVGVRVVDEHLLSLQVQQIVGGVNVKVCAHWALISQSCWTFLHTSVLCSYFCDYDIWFLPCLFWVVGLCWRLNFDHFRSCDTLIARLNASRYRIAWVEELWFGHRSADTWLVYCICRLSIVIWRLPDNTEVAAWRSRPFFLLILDAWNQAVFGNKNLILRRVLCHIALLNREYLADLVTTLSSLCIYLEVAL